jgi:dipeptidyl aminopeptidase/acylaminoacyl peptidase
MRIISKFLICLCIVLPLLVSSCTPAKIVAVVPTIAAGPDFTSVPDNNITEIPVATPGEQPTEQFIPVETQAPVDALPTDVPATETPPVEATQTEIPTQEPTATPNLYGLLTIDYLSSRLYGLDGFQVEQVMASNNSFTRTLISYPSDGLRIYGFMDTPKKAAPPYPVIIAVHGYIDPSAYQTLDYTTQYADALARAGYLVIHPNLRGYQPSDNGPNLLRVGMAVDVLNLISIVKSQGGQPGPLEQANPQDIGLWGHSMGGGIVLRVITVNNDVRAAILYGAMSGDEKQNFLAISNWSGGTRGMPELTVPDDDLRLISPINYLDRITAAVSINHGEADPLVPLSWSADLFGKLQALNKTVELFTYPNEGHTFTGPGNDLFEQRMIAFFDEYLR